MSQIFVTRREFIGPITIVSEGFESWTSYERALTDLDPFQNGAHTTMPAWYVVTQLEYVLGSVAS